MRTPPPQRPPRSTEEEEEESAGSRPVWTRRTLGQASVLPRSDDRRSQRGAAARGAAWANGRRRFSYSLARDRGRGNGRQPDGAGRMYGFSPPSKWSVDWRTSYDVVAGAFNDHVVRLTRQMHRWEAEFSLPADGHRQLDLPLRGGVDGQPRPALRLRAADRKGNRAGSGNREDVADRFPGEPCKRPDGVFGNHRRRGSTRFRGVAARVLARFGQRSMECPYPGTHRPRVSDMIRP